MLTDRLGVEPPLADCGPDLPVADPGYPGAHPLPPYAALEPETAAPDVADTAWLEQNRRINALIRGGGQRREPRDPVSIRLSIMPDRQWNEYCHMRPRPHPLSNPGELPEEPDFEVCRTPYGELVCRCGTVALEWEPRQVSTDG